MRRFALLVLLVAMVAMVFVGCSEEQENAVKEGAAKTSQYAPKVAPFLPPPFDLIAYAIGGIGSATAAVIALKQKRRAESEAARARLEQQARENVARGLNALTDTIDGLRENEATKEITEKFLEKLDGAKRVANPYIKDGLLIADAIRRSPTHVNN